jgi:hypothetical protein
LISAGVLTFTEMTIKQRFLNIKKSLIETYGEEKYTFLFKLVSEECRKTEVPVYSVFVGIEPFVTRLSYYDFCHYLALYFDAPFLLKLVRNQCIKNIHHIITHTIYHYLTLSVMVRIDMTAVEFLSTVRRETSSIDYASLNSELNMILFRLLVNKRGQIVPEDIDDPALLYLIYLSVAVESIQHEEMFSEIHNEYTGLLQKKDTMYRLVVIKLLIYFYAARKLSFQLLHRFIFSALYKKNVIPAELIGYFYDFYLDNRFRYRHLKSMFNMLYVCVNNFYPHKKQYIIPLVNLLKDFIRISRAFESQYLKVIIKLFTLHPHIELSEWVAEGARIIRKFGDASESARVYFNRDSDVSRTIWEKCDTGIYFDQIYRRLYFFCSGITEKTIYLHKNEDAPLGGESEVFYTDGTSIYIPRYVNYVKDKEKNYMILLHSAAHECAHIEFGSFEKNKRRYEEVARSIRQITGNKKELSSYGHGNEKMNIITYFNEFKIEMEKHGYETWAVEFPVHDLPPLVKLMFHFDYPFLIKTIFNIIEDYRVDSMLYAQYSGFGKEKGEVDEVDFSHQNDITNLPALNNLVFGFMQQVHFGKTKGEIHRENKPVLQKITLYFEEFKAAGNPDVYESMKTAAYIYKEVIELCARKDPLYARSLTHKQRRLESEMNRGKRNRDPLFEIGYIKERIKGTGSTGTMEKDIRQKKARHRMMRKIKNEYKNFSREDHPVKEHNIRNIYFYPEWDYEKTCYIKNRCCLGEVEGIMDHVQGHDPVGKGYGGILAAIKKVFMMMKPNQYEDRKGMDDGYEIDFDRYIDALMDLKTGQQMESNVYIRRERKVRDVLAALVMDMSPSTKAAPLSIRGKTEGCRIFLYEKHAVYLLAEAMHTINDRFGIFSFYDHGADCCLFFTLKDFDESYDSFYHHHILSHFWETGHGYSRLATGIRHILNKMQTYDVKTKIIFFITDGLPVYYEGFIDNNEMSSYITVDGRLKKLEKPVPVVEMVRKDNEFVFHDMRKTYEEAAFAGVNLFCITLDRSTVDFIRQCFGKNYIFLPDITTLPVQLVTIFRHITR